MLHNHFAVCSEDWTDVMFTAIIKTSSSEYQGPGHMRFEQLELDYGNAFDIDNGIFTAPLNGTYEFSLTRHRGSDYADILVERNGIDQLRFHGSSYSYDSICPTWLMVLNLGDQVRIRIRSGTIYSDSSRNTIFTGRIINPYDIAFSYVSNDYETVTSDVLSFNNMLVNHGNYFNRTVFKAPKAGIYQFSFMATSYSNNAQIQVMKKDFLTGTETAVLKFYTSSTLYNSFGPNWIMPVFKGDEIWLKVTQGSIFTDDEANRIFNGQLILHNAPGAVIFCVYSYSGTYSSYITFQSTFVNIGGSIIPSSGIFQAPISGTYEFSFTSQSYSSGRYVSVYHNGYAVYYIYCDANSYSSISSKWIMNLQKLDEVRLYACNYMYANSDMYTVFSGKLIQKCESKSMYCFGIIH